MENVLRVSFRPGLVSCCTIAVLVLALASPSRSLAQAGATASRGAGISAFGGYINSNPEYGSARNTGEAFGLNLIKFLKLPVNPSLEGRYNRDNGTYAQETSTLGGIRLQTDALHAFKVHPYVDFLIGSGTIHFNTNSPGYTSDNSTVYNFGGGVDIDLIHNFQLKADYQYQHWKLGQESDAFTPNLILIGVTYQFHFRDYNRYGD
jgi:opacity protein-like surface antigen